MSKYLIILFIIFILLLIGLYEFNNKKYKVFRINNSKYKINNQQGNNLISIILPSYKRPSLLINRTIKSIFNTTKSYNNIELLIGLNDNDDISKNYINNSKYLKKLKQLFNIKIFYYKNISYYTINNILNDLALRSSGKYIYFIDDDMKMLTKNWDVKLLKLKVPKLVIIYFKDINCWGYCHPIISRELFKVLGNKFSYLKLNDAYYLHLAYNAKIGYRIDHIKTRELKCNSKKWKNELKPSRCKTKNKYDNQIKKTDLIYKNMVLNNIKTIINHPYYIKIKSPVYIKEYNYYDI